MKTVSELVQREVMITNTTLPPPCCSMAFPKTHHFHTTYDSPCLVALAAETDQTETSALTEEWWVWEGGGCHSLHKHERIGTISPNSSGERNHYNRPRQKKKWWHWYCLCWSRFNLLCPSEQHCPISLFSLLSSRFTASAPVWVEGLNKIEMPPSLQLIHQ